LVKIGPAPFCFSYSYRLTLNSSPLGVRPQSRPVRPSGLASQLLPCRVVKSNFALPLLPRLVMI